MRKIALALLLLGLPLALVFASAPAHAQATRTWVSGVGDDANPCSRTAPCKTWAGAISKTAPGGEINALDPGGFGAVTITKSITIDGGGGQIASVLVAGTNGIVVAAGPTDIVTIRNVQFDGILGNGSNPANAGLNAIRFLSGKMLSVEHCTIFGFNGSGIDVATSAASILNVYDTSITNAVTGIFLEPAASSVNGSANRVTIQKMSSRGINTNTGAVNFTVTNSVIVNVAGIAVNNAGTGAGTVLEVDSSNVSNNVTGFQTAGGTIRVSRNVVYDNTTNFQGTISSSGDNNVGAATGGSTPTVNLLRQ